MGVKFKGQALSKILLNSKEVDKIYLNSKELYSNKKSLLNEKSYVFSIITLTLSTAEGATYGGSFSELRLKFASGWASYTHLKYTRAYNAGFVFIKDGLGLNPTATLNTNIVNLPWLDSLASNQGLGSIYAQDKTALRTVSKKNYGLNGALVPYANTEASSANFASPGTYEVTFCLQQYYNANFELLGGLFLRGTGFFGDTELKACTMQTSFYTNTDEWILGKDPMFINSSEVKQEDASEFGERGYLLSFKHEQI